MIKKNPKISVIVPIYNAKDYIEKCIESILSQTYQNFEIILIDDGSTDDSPLICDLYARQDSRIHVFHIANTGVSFARNYGIKKMTGDYVFFIDADDFIDCNALEESIYNLEEDCITKISYKYIENSQVKTTVSFSKNVDSNKYIESILFGTAGGHCWGYLIDKNFLINTYFDDNTSCMEDTIFIITCLLKVKTVKLIDSAFYNYVYNGNSITSNNKKIASNIIDYFYSIDSIDKILNDSYHHKLIKRKTTLLKSELHKIVNKDQLQSVFKNEKLNDLLSLLLHEDIDLYTRLIIKTSQIKISNFLMILIKFNLLLTKIRFCFISKLKTSN